MKKIASKNKILITLIAVLICLLSLAFVLAKNNNSAEVKADNTCDSVLSGGSSYSFNNDGIYFNYSIDNFGVLNNSASNDSNDSVVVYAVFTNDDTVYNTIKSKNTFGVVNGYDNNCSSYRVVASNYNSWFSNTFSNCTVISLTSNTFSMRYDSKKDLKKVFVFSFYHNIQEGVMHQMFDEYYVTSCSNKIENYSYESQMISSLEGNSLSDNNRMFTQKFLGIYNSSRKADLVIRYKTFDTSRKKIVDVEQPYQVDSLYLQNVEYIKQFLHLGNHTGSSYNNGYYLTDFLVKRETKYYDELLAEYVTDDRVVLEPISSNPFTFTYNGSTSASVVINYNEYQAKEIHIEVRNNSIGILENLDFDIYSSHITFIEGARTGYIDFMFDEVCANLNNNMGWSVTLDETCFAEDSDNSNFIVKGFGYQLINEGNGLRIYFDKDNQEQMYNSEIVLIAKIEPNFYYDLDVIYYEYTFNENTFEFTKEEKVKSYRFSENEKIYKSAIQNVLANSTDSYNNFNNLFNGQSRDYFPACGSYIKAGYENIYKNVVALTSCEKIASNIYSQATLLQQAELLENNLPMTAPIGKMTIMCMYEVQPFFAITYKTITNDAETITHDIELYALNGLFEAKDFLKDLTIDNWHRLESVTIDDELLLISGCSVDYVNPLNNKFHLLNTNGFDNDNYIIPVEVVISDEMLINFEFFERYKDRKGNITPFAIKSKVENFKVKVVDFKDITKPTATELCAALLKSPEYKNRLEKDLGILTVEKTGEPLVQPINEKIELLTDLSQNGVFYYNLPYSAKSLKKQESNGKDFDEVLIPLTTYGEWTTQFSGDGEPWNVEMLNHEGSSFRLYNSDIEPDKLYGLFATINFEEQVTNLNDWFAGTTAGGCVVEYESKQVKGSDLYKFADRISLGTGSQVIDTIAFSLPCLIKAGCEIFDDDNCTVYSHFFYLDGTTDLPFMSNSKADNYDDNGSAIVNTGEDVVETVGDAIDGIFNNPYIMLGLVIVTAFAIIIIAGYASIKLERVRDKKTRKLLKFVLFIALALLAFVVCWVAFPSIKTLF